MKRFNSISTKVTIGIFITVLLVISTVGIISTYRINQGFDVFLEEQGRAGVGFGGGRNQSEDAKEQRHEEIIDQFQEEIYGSIILASLIGIIISVVIGTFISRQITAPIDKLSNQIDEATKNNFETIKLQTSTKEIDELIMKYNTLINELKRIEMLRDDLVSDVTHELKTPLTKIRGQIEGCIDEVYECDEDHLNKTLNNVTQLEDLLAQMQKLVQLRSKEYDLEITEINLKELVGSMISGYQKENVSIMNEIGQEVSIKADKAKFKEIMDNLISNAVNYTDDGRVEVSYNVNVLKIEDTGKGISEKDLPYIFERFFRAERSRNKDTGGLGLGLAITKELVEAHGWKIDVESKIGTGTTFYITIPQ